MTRSLSPLTAHEAAHRHPDGKIRHRRGGASAHEARIGLSVPILDATDAIDQPASADSPDLRALARGDVDWRHLAACATTSADLFTGQNRETHHQRKRREDAAKAVCRSCAVSTWCLRYALDNDESDGVWGGLDAGERAAVGRS